VDENPYEPPQRDSKQPHTLHNYHPLALTRKLIRIWWFVAIVSAIIAVGRLLLA
jgi:hypothetical protein